MRSSRPGPERRKRLAAKRRLYLAEGMPYLMETLPCNCMACVRDTLNLLFPPDCPLKCCEEKSATADTAELLPTKRNGDEPLPAAEMVVTAPVPCRIHRLEQCKVCR